MEENNEQKLTSAQRRTVIKRTLRAVNEADKGHLLRETLAYLTELASGFVVIFLSALVIDGISQSKQLDSLLTCAITAAAVQAVLSVIRCLLRRRSSYHVFSRNMGLHRRLWKKAMTMELADLESADTRDRYIKASRQPENEQAGIASACNNIRRIAGGAFMIAAGAAMLIPFIFRKPPDASGFAGFIMSPWGFVAAAAAAALLEVFRSAVITPMGIKGFEKAHNDMDIIRAVRKESYLNDYVLKNYRHGKEIRIYSQQKLIERELDSAQKTITAGWFGAYRKAMLPGLLFQLAAVITKVLMFGFAVIRAAGGMLTAGEVIAFAMYFEKISAGVSDVSEGLAMLKMIPVFCQQYFDFLDIPDTRYKGSIPTEKRSDNEYEFEFRHVWFRYPNTDRYVLQDVNLKWRIGEKMALVGRNGSGKSTLVKLLCRLYDPTEGEITLNGIDIRKYDSSEYTALFSVVFQDSGLFSFSLAENVAASDVFDTARVEDCVRRSGLSEWLDGQPNGTDTFLYKDFDENGVEISGGEAQKLCLARAVYKGAPFIVLDEPTAALDPVSEHEIYTGFNSIVGTRTAIYISHRLSSCRFCDEITVMDNGRIVERGSHEALTAAGGHYAQMWSAQSEYYRDTAAALFE